MDQPPSLLDLAHEEHGDAPNGGGGSGDEARATLDEQEILDDINLDEIEEALRYRFCGEELSLRGQLPSRCQATWRRFLTR